MLNLFQIAQIIIPTPPVYGPGLTLVEIGNIIYFIGSVLTNIGVIFAVIAVIVSGIMYMRAGGNPEAVKKAQQWLRNALIGSLIVIGVGVIINTIDNVVTRAFFCRLIILGRCIF